MRDREALLLNSYQQFLQMLDAILKSTPLLPTLLLFFSVSQKFFELLICYIKNIIGYRVHRQKVKRQKKTILRKKNKGETFNMNVDEHIDKDVKEEWVIAVKCLGELLRTASHFNFSWNIVSLIVPLMNADDEKLRAVCCGAIEAVFDNDTRGSTTLQTVKLIGQFVKAKSFNVHNEVNSNWISLLFTPPPGPTI